MKTLLFLSGLLLLITGCSKKENITPDTEIVSVGKPVLVSQSGINLNFSIDVKTNTPVDTAMLNKTVWKWKLPWMRNDKYTVDASKTTVTFYITNFGNPATKKYPYTYDWVDKGGKVEHLSTYEVESDQSTDDLNF